uniref:Bm9868 n=2 Tax=Brugia malayi TaxID=6279 RepID=A0A0J9XU32_BRUMA|nr:Bm9868 [Brugia malayi]
MISLDRSPIFALDQLKQAGVPFEKQLSPYLQMDPTVFRDSTPQRIFMYIVPGESKGELEFAMGRLDGLFWAAMHWAVCAVFCQNCGILIRGSGFAHPAGSIVFIFSLADMIFGKLRTKDDLNAVAAGAVTGGLFRCARGLHASMVGAGIGVFAAFIWLLSDQDSRNRLWEVRKHLNVKQDYIY